MFDLTSSTETDPGKKQYNEELEHIFYAYCSYVCLISNKKLNIANIFIKTLETPELFEIYMQLGDHRNKYDLARSFFTIEPSLQKSKYIKRYINKNVEN